ncbi:hypothetical protein EUX98_g7182 [Antrodiella citrinella]|uniref:Uncharacterized protein n=1 Tax=Antrodiella citrinella TaxID=2447956 RepID=A0A4S4MMF3_9APHY|nr:hypothetical protein EUX98_g7182 [Antrodiella citrinella]
MAPSAQHSQLPDTATVSELCVGGSDMYIPDTYAYDLSHLTPIDRLPVELLIDIFVTCARDVDGNPLVPLVLSHVCRSWLDILFACPRAWQFLSLTDARSRSSTNYQSLVWFKYSKALPLDVRIEVSNVDLLLPLLIPLLPHIHRWRRWHITGKVTEDVDFTSFSIDGSRAILDDVQITIRGTSELEDLHANEGPNHIFSSFQSYVHPEVHKVALRLNVLTLPPIVSMGSMLLRNLTISESTLEVVSDPIRMLEFLEFCPCLENFHYYGFPQEPPSYPDPPARPSIVTLPRLRVLVVRSTCAVRIILSHITAPMLSELYLEHTNMEFEPDIATYPYDPEEGDSDDENQDFSQSPWSDHATGMGLRSLIRRSNPPLELLAMDYADMRTKDFEWCFDRMNTLQEFRIVASDMSDKVVSMFAPASDRPLLGTSSSSTAYPEEYYGSDTDSSGSYPSPTYDDEPVPAFQFTAEPSPPLRVRLPRLTTLELWNCQRLSGDAIVHALSARTRYTDEQAVAEGGREKAKQQGLLKMEEVAVIGCLDFYPRHAVDLGITLGNRLRIS